MSETTTIGLRMAKATPEDFKAFETIIGILNDIDDDQYPRDVDGEFKESDPDYFDIDDEAHCRAALRRLMRLMRRQPGCLNRVHGMAHCADYNEVFDPDKDYLAWHPALQQAADERHRGRVIAWAKEHVAELPPIQWRRLDGARFNNEFDLYEPELYADKPNQGYILRYRKGGENVTYPEIPPTEEHQPVRISSQQGVGWFWVNFSQEVPK